MQIYLILLENVGYLQFASCLFYGKIVQKHFSDINKNILFTNNQAQHPLTVIMLQLLFTTSY